MVQCLGAFCIGTGTAAVFGGTSHDPHSSPVVQTYAAYTFFPESFDYLVVVLYGSGVSTVDDSERASADIHLGDISRPTKVKRGFEMCVTVLCWLYFGYYRVELVLPLGCG